MGGLLCVLFYEIENCVIDLVVLLLKILKYSLCLVLDDVEIVRLLNDLIMVVFCVVEGNFFL